MLNDSWSPSPQKVDLACENPHIVFLLVNSWFVCIKEYWLSKNKCKILNLTDVPQSQIVSFRRVSWFWLAHCTLVDQSLSKAPQRQV